MVNWQIEAPALSLHRMHSCLQYLSWVLLRNDIQSCFHVLNHAYNKVLFISLWRNPWRISFVPCPHRKAQAAQVRFLRLREGARQEAHPTDGLAVGAVGRVGTSTGRLVGTWWVFGVPTESVWGRLGGLPTKGLRNPNKTIPVGYTQVLGQVNVCINRVHLATQQLSSAPQWFWVGHRDTGPCNDWWRP